MSSALHPIVGVSGHRDMPHPKEDIKAALKKHLEILRPSLVLTGMAIGFDQLVADVCLDLGIPYTAAVPFVGQQSTWPMLAIEHYNDLLDKAHQVRVISAGGWSNAKFHIRNQWIVNNSTHLVCYWDGTDQGGTAGCVKYAKSKGKPITNVFSELTLPAAYQAKF